MKILIRWPWEPNDLEVALRRLQEEGSRTVARLTKERESLRRSAAEQIARVKDRSRIMTQQIIAIDSRLVFGQNPVETDLLMKQAHAFYEQGQYDRSLDASDQAAQKLTAQAAILISELGRYASRDRISPWKQMAKDHRLVTHSPNLGDCHQQGRSSVDPLQKRTRRCYHTPFGSGSMVFERSDTRETAPPRKAAIGSAVSAGRDRLSFTGPWSSTIPTKTIDDATSSGERRDRSRLESHRGTHRNPRG